MAILDLLVLAVQALAVLRGLVVVVAAMGTTPEMLVVAVAREAIQRSEELGKKVPLLMAQAAAAELVFSGELRVAVGLSILEEDLRAVQLTLRLMAVLAVLMAVLAAVLFIINSHLIGVAVTVARGQ